MESTRSQDSVNKYLSMWPKEPDHEAVWRRCCVCENSRYFGHIFSPSPGNNHAVEFFHTYHQAFGISNPVLNSLARIDRNVSLNEAFNQRLLQLHQLQLQVDIDCSKSSFPAPRDITSPATSTIAAKTPDKARSLELKRWRVIAA